MLPKIKEILSTIDPIISNIQTPDNVDENNSSIIYFFTDTDNITELQLQFFIFGENLEYSFHIKIKNDRCYEEYFEHLAEERLTQRLHMFITNSMMKYRKAIESYNNYRKVMHKRLSFHLIPI